MPASATASPTWPTGGCASATASACATLAPPPSSVTRPTEILTGPPRRLSRDEIDRCVRQIEEL